MDILERWNRTLRALGADAPELGRELIARWSEPHRRYHTVEHLEHCLREIESLPFARPAEAELAAWFHDAIYEARAGAENEARSAKLAEEKLGALGIESAHVSAMVRATEAHASMNDPDGDLFLDVDMCILGQPEGTFDAYEAGVRAEWSWVPEELFREKRAEFVRGVLAGPSVFLTAVMRARYEEKARANLARSLRKLGG